MPQKTLTTFGSSASNRSLTGQQAHTSEARMGNYGAYVMNPTPLLPTIGMQAAKVQFKPAVRKPNSSTKPPAS